MHTMTFNGQQIALRCFSNSHEKMVYVDNVHVMGISTYYHGIRIGHSELMHFNDLHLFMDRCFKNYTDTHVYAYE